MTGIDPCKVLVILGASGTGKSTASANLGRQLGRSWLQVDDLRLALQFSGLLKREPEDEMNTFFAPDVWRKPTGEIVRALIRVVELMDPSLRIVIHSHVVTDAPVIIEGDGVHPRLARDPLLQPLVRAGTIRFCCLATPPAEAIYRNMVARNRGIDTLAKEDLFAQAAVYAAIGTWLERESERAGIPVIASTPQSTLPARIPDAVGF